jgi:hypothetical protein
MTLPAACGFWQFIPFVLTHCYDGTYRSWGGRCGAGLALTYQHGLLILGFLCTTWFAAKVYRTGILMYGKKPTWKEMWKWHYDAPDAKCLSLTKYLFQSLIYLQSWRIMFRSEYAGIVVIDHINAPGY